MAKAKPVTLKCLLDTGASGSLISKEHAKKLRQKKLEGTQTVWTTPGGDLKTNYKCQCTFVMPEFFRDKVIERDLHVSPNLGAYDMIIGRDVLSALGFKFDFATMTIEWDHAHVPMKDSTEVAEEAFYIQDPEAVLLAVPDIRDWPWHMTRLPGWYWDH
jgi:predicted aspartyl protease